MNLSHKQLPPASYTMEPKTSYNKYRAITKATNYKVGHYQLEVEL